MGALPVMDVAERRARLGRRQHLARSALADSPLEVAQSLVALHATDPATVFLSAWLGAIRITPRFRTPLERELSG